MVDIHYFIFIVNADFVVFASVVFAMAFVALKLIYRMWRSSLRCPRCGESYKNQPESTPTDRTLPSSLWAYLKGRS